LLEIEFEVLTQAKVKSCEELETEDTKRDGRLQREWG
jgi:hypothetical protein